MKKKKQGAISGLFLAAIVPAAGKENYSGIHSV
jgi:hypothetical protein